ncbi:MAG: tetratricopeptide repeat protein [Candidatus Omnitrophica bacterium]|nr:tetratricopeptide repeat protein [Candidatus Omnitrophota bacterium]
MDKQFSRSNAIALACLAPLFLCTSFAFASNQAVDYLCELGKVSYAQGRIDNALSDFNKALLIDPDNKIAKEYVNLIFKQNNDSVAEFNELVLTNPLTLEEEPFPSITKQEAMEREMAKLKGYQPNPAYLYGYPDLMPHEEETERGIRAGPIKITGDAQLSFGIASPDDFIWKRANYDLNEKHKSWRVTSNDGFNRRMNTFNTRVYDSLSVNLDTENESGFNFHTNVTVDPWSFRGKSEKVTVTSGVNNAGIQLYYWSNTGYTVTNTAYTSNNDTFSLPEVKVKDGKTDPFSATSWRASNVYNIPGMKINRQFQPVREFWLDYVNDTVKFRVFPIAYQDQSYSSNDPLGITNHGIWWKDSKWLRRYVPGNASSSDFVKGRWDDSLSFISKDSTGKYLTSLRGFSLSFYPQEQTSFDTTFATPLHLWQDYGEVDNIISASRLKHFFMDNFMLGGAFTYRGGFKTDPHKLDSQNFVGGVDLGFEVVEGFKAQAEVLTSKSEYDKTNSDYKTESRGNAYYLSFVTRYPQQSIMDLKYGYDDIKIGKDEDFLLKSKFYLVRMDKGFDSALSDYHNTRQDTFWSRHIHFRRPMQYYYSGLEKPAKNWDELLSSRIGDGIDAGRNTLGYRFELFLDDSLYNLFDIRNVHNVNGKFIENVVRDELSVRVTDKLTAKVLGIYQKLPRTVGGIDPYIYDGNTGDFWTNAVIKDGEKTTIKTGSFGLNYDFFDWLSINGIYERTNDYYLAYDGFPINVLKNDTTLGGTYYQNDHLYRRFNPFLYSQGNFPQAPYSFYNIFKTGLRISPLDNMEIYLDYTRNEFEVASLNSDNMNHIGLEFTYMPTPKIGMLFKYIYSRCQDIDRLVAGVTKPIGHHNFYAEFRYLPTKDDEFIMQYGEGNASAIGNMTLDPYGGSMLTLDTAHIFRFYYRRKF